MRYEDVMPLPEEIYFEAIDNFIRFFPYPRPPDDKMMPEEKEFTTELLCKETDRDVNIIDGKWVHIIDTYLATASLFLLDSNIVSVSSTYNTITEIKNDFLFALFKNYIYNLRKLTEYEIPSPAMLAGDFKLKLAVLERDFYKTDWIYTTEFRRPYVQNKVLYRNFWSNFKIAKNEENSEGIEKILQVFQNLQDEEQRQWLINALAYKLKNPKTKGHFIIFYGKQGTGKTALAELCGRILGGYESLTEQVLNSRFTSWLDTGALLFVVNEYYFTRSNINFLKDFITNEKVIIEKKNKTPFEGRNYSWFILTTNDVNSFNIRESSDRISLLSSFTAKVRFTEKQRNLDEWITDEDIEAFRHYLINLDIDYPQPYSTEIKKYSEELLATPLVIHLVNRLIEDAGDLYASSTVELTDGALFVANEWITNTLEAVLSENSLSKTFTSIKRVKQDFQRYLNFILPSVKKVDIVKHYFKNVQKRAWKIPIHNVKDLNPEKLATDILPENPVEEQIDLPPF